MPLMVVKNWLPKTTQITFRRLVKAGKIIECSAFLNILYFGRSDSKYTKYSTLFLMPFRRLLCIKIFSIIYIFSTAFKIYIRQAFAKNVLP